MARIIALIFLIASCFSAKFWVNSSSGNDGWPGSSPDSAFASLGAAANAMTQLDTAYAFGQFNETLTLANSKHEGCLFAPWPDSAAWVIDGDSIRYCVLIGDYCGAAGERPVLIFGLTALDGSTVNILLNETGSLELKSCSLATHTIGIQAVRSHLVIDSTVISTAGACLNLNGSLAYPKNCSLNSSADYCVKEVSNASVLVSVGNFYSGYGGIYCYNGLSAQLSGDRFRVTNSAILASRYPPQGLSLRRCLFVGGEFAISSTSYNSTQPFISIVNCTFDSMDNALSFSGLRGAVTIINSIITNCGKAIDSPDLIRAAGLVINSCGTDTVGLKSRISYSRFDPMLDSLKIAQADSASIIGHRSSFGFDAPIQDDLGRTFINGNSVAVGWRSPLTESPMFEPTANNHKWGIRAPGRRLK